MAHPNEEPVRRGFAAFERGDLDALRELFTPDVLWHAPGRNPLAGTFKGVDEVLASFGRLQELCGGTYRNELHDVVGGDEHTFAAYVATAQREGRSVRVGAVLMAHVRDGRIAEVWTMTGDQYVWDAFLA